MARRGAGYSSKDNNYKKKQLLEQVKELCKVSCYVPTHQEDKCNCSATTYDY